MPSPVYRGIFALALLLPLWSGPVAAFGPSGHRYVGYVAERYLCPETVDALTPLLAEKSLPGRSLATAGLWPDTIRREPRWRHSGPWHYINVDDHGSLRTAVRRRPANVLTVLGTFEKELRDGSLPVHERAIALRFVIHLVADIHQPLHVGRARDRGGNEIRVRIRGKVQNLHRVWDGQWLWKRGEPGPRAGARSLPMRSRRMVRRWQATGPWEWAQESLDLRPRIYAFETGTAVRLSERVGVPVDLPPAYLDDVRTILQARLEMAGIRLAGRLNAALGGSTDCWPKVASRPTTH